MDRFDAPSTAYGVTLEFDLQEEPIIRNHSLKVIRGREEGLVPAQHSGPELSGDKSLFPTCYHLNSSVDSYMTRPRIHAHRSVGIHEFGGQI